MSPENKVKGVLFSIERGMTGYWNVRQDGRLRGTVITKKQAQELVQKLRTALSEQ